jgi:hypothetical protein
MVAVADEGGEIEGFEADLLRHTESGRNARTENRTNAARNATIALVAEARIQVIFETMISEIAAIRCLRFRKKSYCLVQTQSVWDICERGSAAKKKSTRPAPKYQTMKRIVSGIGNETYLSIHLHHFYYLGVGDVAGARRRATAAYNFLDNCD